MGQNESSNFTSSQGNIIGSGYLGWRYNIKMIIKMSQLNNSKSGPLNYIAS